MIQTRTGVCAHDPSWPSRVRWVRVRGRLGPTCTANGVQSLAEADLADFVIGSVSVSQVHVSHRPAALDEEWVGSRSSVQSHARGGRGPAALQPLLHVLREPDPQLAYHSGGRSTVRAFM